MMLFRTTNVFEDLTKDVTAWMKSVDPVLRQRAAIRFSTFQVAGLGAEDFSTYFDRSYAA